MTTKYSIDRSTTCLLPIGIYKDGKYYREVTFDKWKGEDHERLTTAAGKRNPGRAITDILRRLIQEIPGVVQRKSSKWDLIAKEILDNMFGPDIDFLILQTIAASRRNTKKAMEFCCPHCDTEMVEEIELTDIMVTPFEGGEPFFEFELTDGIELEDREGNDVVARKGKFYFPTGKVKEELAKFSADGELAQFTEMIALCVKDFDVVGIITPLMARRSMSFDDRTDLLTDINKMTAGADVKQEVVCSACDKKSEFSIEVHRFFF